MHAERSQVRPLRRDSETWRRYGLVGLFAYLLYALGAITPYLKAEFRLSNTLVGLHSSAFAIGLIISGLVGDRIAARFSAEQKMSAAACGEAAAGAVMALIPHPAATLAASLVMGLCGSVMLALVNASLAEKHQEHSAQVLTEAQVVASLCSLSTALLLGFFVGQHLGWRPVLILPIAVLILGGASRFCLQLRASRNAGPPGAGHGQGDVPSGGREAEKQTNRRAGRLPVVFWLRWAVTVDVIAIEFALVFWGPSALRVRPGLDASAASAMMAFFIGGMLAGRVIGSMLFAKLKGSFILPVGAGIAAVGALLLRLSSSPVLSSIGLLLAGLGVANLYATAVDAAIASAPSQAVTAAARCSLAFGVALLAGPPVFGALADSVGILDALEAVIVLAGIAAALHGAGVLIRRRTSE